jgi:hypothetical protein
MLDAEPLRDGLVVFDDVGVPIEDAGLRCETGGLRGLVCTPSGAPIAGARVVAASRDCDGEVRIIEVEANRDGVFWLRGLVPGPATVSIRLGSFFAHFDSEVFAHVTTPINGDSDKVCLDASSTKMAVLTGDFDRIQDLLGGLGFEYDLYCGDRDNHRGGRALLADWATLSTYDILFVNCTSGIDLGDTNLEVQLARENLHKFVRQGGSVYVSDLSADFVRRGWPGWVTFAASQSVSGRANDACCTCVGEGCTGECVVEPTPPRGCDGCCEVPNELPQQCRSFHNGTVGHGSIGYVQAAVSSPFLQAYLADSAFEVHFNLGGWVPITDVAPGVEVLVESSEGEPLMVLFEPEPGGGRVAYTSFHNHAQASNEMRAILEALVFRL